MAPIHPSIHHRVDHESSFNCLHLSPCIRQIVPIIAAASIALFLLSSGSLTTHNTTQHLLVFSSSFIPIINTTRAFRASSLHTLAITSNNEVEIDKFFADNRTPHLESLCNSGNFSVGIDEGKVIKGLQEDFGVKTVPHVYVLVGGEVVWEGHPTGLESVVNYYVGQTEDSSSDSE